MGLDWIITEEVHVETIRGKYVLAQLECCDLIAEDLRDSLYEDDIEYDSVVSLVGCIEQLIDEMRAQTPLAHNMQKEDDSQSWDAFFEEEIEYFTEVSSHLQSFNYTDDRRMTASY
jgi:hypothetical protein